MKSELDRFQQQLAAHHLAPLWQVLRTLAPREPPAIAAPALWPAALLREQVLAAGRLISAEQAERRVLVLENPALSGQSRITPSLYAGVQLILPGERARSHRHTATALRLVLTGEGAYTCVDGERVAMHPGDFIITPSWSFHEHANEGSEPVIWLDGLDIPVVNLLGAAFSEDDAVARRPQTRASGDALARYGSGLVPVEYVRQGAACPLFCYPYERTRAALEQLQGSATPDDEPLRLMFTDPTTGASPILTMGAFVQLIPAGVRTRPYRCTDGTVFAVLEGAAEVHLEHTSWTIAPHDIFVVPGWSWHSFAARRDTVLFSFSDRPLQQILRLWREQRA
jgi:gentisate 1,2-dioxygenase